MQFLTNQKCIIGRAAFTFSSRSRDRQDPRKYGCHYLWTVPYKVAISQKSKKNYITSKLSLDKYPRTCHSAYFQRLTSSHTKLVIAFQTRFSRGCSITSLDTKGGHKTKTKTFNLSFFKNRSTPPSPQKFKTVQAFRTFSAHLVSPNWPLI